jgi:gluconokinase
MSESVNPVAIVVMGVSGSGKTTLGQALASRIGCPFVEGDELHLPASIEKMRNGVPLQDEDRWDWLERVGRRVGDEARDKGAAVITCSALKRTYRDLIRKSTDCTTRFVVLIGSKEEIVARVARRKGHYMPSSLVDSQFSSFELPDPDEHALLLSSTDSRESLLHQAFGWLSEQFIIGEVCQIDPMRGAG